MTTNPSNASSDELRTQLHHLIFPGEEPSEYIDNLLDQIDRLYQEHFAATQPAAQNKPIRISCECTTCSGYCACNIPGHHDDVGQPIITDASKNLKPSKSTELESAAQSNKDSVTTATPSNQSVTSSPKTYSTDGVAGDMGEDEIRKELEKLETIVSVVDQRVAENGDIIRIAKTEKLSAAMIDKIMPLISQARAAQRAEDEKDMLKKPNDLLRSAYQIAQRRGKDVNWDAFCKQLEAELEREHTIMYPVSSLIDPQGTSE